ncbi:MAG TPA: hypothetical protein VFK36_09950 [Gemmatimonadales bacterium]|nr:hypothetical protein [Gemmatimonadales bacterium]
MTGWRPPAAATANLDCTAISASAARKTAGGLSLALAAASGGVGGTVRNFSPHEVVFPGSVNLSFVAQLKNQGSFVEVCNDTADTDQNGIATFTAASVNKAGGYTLVAHTVPPTSDPDVTTFAPDSVSSNLFNVKNGKASTSCS